jgi:phosphohistidine phosphatase
MKTIILIRHAKSSWDLPVQDKDRELIDVGIESIQKIAQKAISILPEDFIIWSSTAKRAMQTAYLFCENASIEKNRIIFKDNLYTFDEYDLSQIIKKCDNNIDNLIVFGHNGAITDFVNKYGNNLIFNVPTSGLVMINFEQDNWIDIKNGKTMHTLFPKEI